MGIDIFILFVTVCAALWSVMTRSLLRTAIGLAVTSALVAVLMFRLSSPLAAVFELSVCSGLISVLFISTISLTQPETEEEKLAHYRRRMKRFWILPILVLAGGVLLSMVRFTLNLSLKPSSLPADARVIIWNARPLDMAGLVVILLAGVMGVVILFKEAQER